MTTRFLRSRTTIGVRSVPEAMAFYARVAGFEALVTMGQPPTFALVVTGDVGLGLVESATAQAADFACCYVEVVGVDDLHRRCVDAGATVTSPLSRQPWGNLDFVIADPDGNQIAFGEVPPR